MEHIDFQNGYDEEKWEEFCQADIRTAVLEEVVDIRNFVPDESLPQAERLRQYLELVHNPFLVRYGDYIIKLEYGECEETVDDRLRQYF